MSSRLHASPRTSGERAATHARFGAWDRHVDGRGHATPPNNPRDSVTSTHPLRLSL